jgi:hypothetical protein
MGLLLRDPYDHSLLCLCWAILRQSEQICNSRRKTLTATQAVWLFGCSLFSVSPSLARMGSSDVERLVHPSSSAGSSKRTPSDQKQPGRSLAATTRGCRHPSCR